MAFSPETYALLKAQGGGGGSSLPTPSAETNGYSLVVKPVLQTAVPEQTITTVEGTAVLSNVVTSLFIVGASCVFTVNGTEAKGTLAAFEGTIVCVVGPFSIGLLDDGETAMFVSESGDGTYTVSLSVVSTTQFEYGLQQTTMEVKFNPDTGIGDRTWSEVAIAMRNGVRVYTLIDDNGTYYEATAEYLHYAGGELFVNFHLANNLAWTIYADSEDGYLYLDE